MITYTTNGNKLADQIAGKLRQAAYQGLMHSARDCRQEMIRLTSGTVSTNILTALHHPFGRKAPARKGLRGGQRGTMARLPINRQTGDLQSSLFDAFSRNGQNEMMWDLGFSIPYASFVLAPGGTRYMVARGFWNELAKTMKPIFKQNVSDAYQAFFP